MATELSIASAVFLPQTFHNPTPAAEEFSATLQPFSSQCSHFFFTHTATTDIYTLSLHDALPICFAFPRGAELPAPFQFGTRTDVWTPLVFDASDVGNYGVQNLVAIGKLSERCGTGACSASEIGRAHV